MFSFQAIHNTDGTRLSNDEVVYRLCQCSLFKQFTTLRGESRPTTPLFIDYVNVLFSSNSQRQPCKHSQLQCCLSIMSMFSFQAIHNSTTNPVEKTNVVYRLCQCSLFKQFTTFDGCCPCGTSCLSIMSMFSFQAIHNWIEVLASGQKVVYRLCQCSLFKQLGGF